MFKQGLIPEIPSSVNSVYAADLHLSINPPAARSVEVDWVEVQRGYLRQVKKVCTKHNAPLVICGY